MCKLSKIQKTTIKSLIQTHTVGWELDAQYFVLPQHLEILEQKLVNIKNDLGTVDSAISGQTDSIFELTSSAYVCLTDW